jgi:hypothetical protein
MAEAKRASEECDTHGNIDPAAAACLMITLGTLQFRENSSDLSPSRTLRPSSVYCAADAAGDAVASALRARFATRERDARARRLPAGAGAQRELIEWNASQHDETLTLSVSRYLRGIVLHECDEYDAALAGIRQRAARCSVTLADEQGVAFADIDAVAAVSIDRGHRRADVPPALRGGAEDYSPPRAPST